MLQNVPQNTAPDREPDIAEENDPVLFMGSMVARAMQVKDPSLRKKLLEDLFFQLSAYGGPVGAAAHYQPAAFGGLDEEVLETDAKGKIRPTIRNYAIILRTAARFRLLRYNTFKGCFEENGQAWTDEDLSRALAYIETCYRLKSRDDFFHALNVVKDELSYHPIIERIAAIQWDGMHRLGGLFGELMGSERTPYTREVGRLLFHCGMARLMHPGCKADCVVILTGRQGSGKSTLARFLALDDDWFTELCDIRDEKKVGEQLRGKWIVELGELNAFHASMEEIKQFATRQTDRYRLAYDRLAQDFPRSCIFIGTTNNPRPLRDRTGNRRFFPVEVTIGGDWLHEAKDGVMPYIEQSWAEAYALYKEGKLQPYVLPELRGAVKEKQADALRDDPCVGDITRYLNEKEAPGTQVCIKQLWHEALGKQDDPKRNDSDFIAALMDNMEGWKRGARITSGIYKGQCSWDRIN